LSDRTWGADVDLVRNPRKSAQFPVFFPDNAYAEYNLYGGGRCDTDWLGHVSRLPSLQEMAFHGCVNNFRAIDSRYLGMTVTSLGEGK
jgi:hypothetical protein